jgi:hypothetical protein
MNGSIPTRLEVDFDKGVPLADLQRARRDGFKGRALIVGVVSVGFVVLAAVVRWLGA